MYGMFSLPGSLIQIRIPRDETTNVHYGYGFAEYEDEDAAEIAFKMMNFALAYHKVYLDGCLCVRDPDRI